MIALASGHTGHRFAPMRREETIGPGAAVARIRAVPAAELITPGLAKQVIVSARTEQPVVPAAPADQVGTAAAVHAIVAAAAADRIAAASPADHVVAPEACDPVCPDPVLVADQLEVRSHRVDVSIADQVATTRIDQVFHNPNSWAAEGTYVFPIPPGATISDFTMTVDGEPVAAKILDAAEARRIYDDIVRRMRDPALLEYIGEGAIQASVFPIPPGADRRVQIEYGEVIPVTDGLARYRYPLNTERFSAQPLAEVSVHVAVETREPLRAVYSPSHDIAIDRPDDFNFAAGYEANDIRPDTDFDLFWSVSPDKLGANIVSYVDANGDGYFLLLAAPGIERPTSTPAQTSAIAPRMPATVRPRRGADVAGWATSVHRVADVLEERDDRRRGADEQRRSGGDERPAPPDAGVVVVARVGAERPDGGGDDQPGQGGEEAPEGEAAD